MSAKKWIIYGCGGHSRSVLDVLLSYEPEASILLIDEAAKEGETLYGFPVQKMGRLTDHPSFLAIGNNALRQKKYNELRPAQLISIHSPKAHIGKNAHLGKGTFVGHFAHIGPEAKIGDHTILNTGCIVEHEVEIGDYCHIAPGAVVCGRSKIGDLVFIGAGAVIRDSITICSNVVIGAGSVVVKSIETPGTYIGCPAAGYQMGMLS